MVVNYSVETQKEHHVSFILLECNLICFAHILQSLTYQDMIPLAASSRENENCFAPSNSGISSVFQQY